MHANAGGQEEGRERREVHTHNTYISYVNTTHLDTSEEDKYTKAARRVVPCQMNPPLLFRLCHLLFRVCVAILVHPTGFSCCRRNHGSGGFVEILFSLSLSLSWCLLDRSSRHRRGTSSSSHQARIAPSLYHQRLNRGEKVGGDGPPSDRISVGELTVPDAKKSLPTATVTVAARGFLPVTGVPLDLLGRGTHVYRMTRLDVRRVLFAVL